jgi:hypothetical protein
VKIAHWLSPHAFTVKGALAPDFTERNLVGKTLMNLAFENIDLTAGFHMLLIDG